MMKTRSIVATCSITVAMLAVFNTVNCLIAEKDPDDDDGNGGSGNNGQTGAGSNGEGTGNAGQGTGSSDPGTGSNEFGYRSIHPGENHTCAVTNEGAAKCWGPYGANLALEISDDVEYQSDSQVGRPVTVDGLGSGVATIAASDEFSCALTTDGTVKCWGMNDKGQLGFQTASEYSNLAKEVTGLGSGNKAIATGYQHACAVTAAGSVKCWGLSRYGQSGVDVGGVLWQARDIPGINAEVTDVTAGNYYT